MKPCIDIVIATYNGDKYLEEQLWSIVNCKQFSQLVTRVIIVDDGSNDKTNLIVSGFQKQYSIIEWHPTLTSSSLGPSQNFSRGIELSDADYIMLSDQDDVWLNDKIENSFNTITNLEKRNQQQLPVLVFSDLKVVDEKLKVINDSYFKTKDIPTSWHESFHKLLMQNVASGCTMIFNRKLKEYALPIPELAYMHDWWLVLTAKLIGEVGFIDKATMLYRQHSNNSIGVKQRALLSILTKLPEYLSKFKKSFQSSSLQAKQLQNELNRYHEHKLSHKELQQLEVFSKFSSLTKSQKLMAFMRGDVTRSSPLGKLGLLLTIVIK